MPETAAIQLRLLIDACLTPAAIPHLNCVFGDRIDATHVDHVLAPGTPDAAVLAWAAREGRLVPTANDMDFVILARVGATHHGLGLINDPEPEGPGVSVTLHFLPRSQPASIEPQ